MLVAENPLLLLMEFVENGSLEKYLRDNKATLKSNMAQLFKWTYQIARVRDVFSFIQSPPCKLSLLQVEERRIGITEISCLDSEFCLLVFRA